MDEYNAGTLGLGSRVLMMGGKGADDAGGDGATGRGRDDGGAGSDDRNDVVVCGIVVGAARQLYLTTKMLTLMTRPHPWHLRPLR